MANNKTLPGEEKVLEQIEESAKEVAAKKVELTEEESALWQKAMTAMKAPVKFDDKDFKLGDGELDVRNLSSKNYKQLMFRMEVAKVAYLRNIAESQIDCIRLLMVLLKQAGVDDIEKATDDLMTELNKKVRENSQNKA